jgi:hypothetical protein
MRTKDGVGSGTGAGDETGTGVGTAVGTGTGTEVAVNAGEGIGVDDISDSICLYSAELSSPTGKLGSLLSNSVAVLSPTSDTGEESEPELPPQAARAATNAPYPRALIPFNVILSTIPIVL